VDRSESLCIAAGFISFVTSGGLRRRRPCLFGEALLRIPDSLSDEAARRCNRLRHGVAHAVSLAAACVRETVMINSVGSGIGSAAVQLARLAGATVIGNASSDEKLVRAIELGMDHGINHATQESSPR